ncbi:hypothetical protein CVT24_008204 [Panaeolus cyanescens]|uniref:Helicase C-terminal domain-containing protein n=1 Tax=Panaeolus cyanescens TaxID=181874 RepID=A0A409VF13_9AGAR|nr:hypothetical protein CVT24_008204 [Panaeolus cyanescens]
MGTICPQPPVLLDVDQLFEAGIVELKFRGVSKEPNAPKAEAEKSTWHLLDPFQLPPGLYIGNKASEDFSLFESIIYLIARHYLQASYASLNEKVLIKIYFVPTKLRNIRTGGGVTDKNAHREEKLARQHLQKVLPAIRPFRGDSKELRSGVAHFLDSSESHLTLADVYSNLASPSPRVIDAMTHRMLDPNDPLDDLGFKNEPFIYQRRAIAAMLQKEFGTARAPDPLFVECKSSSKSWYVQPGTFEIRADRPTVPPCHGGILCEELGTGKTFIILGLILTTLNQLSAPEPSVTDKRPVLTPFSFRHSPSKECIAARSRIKYGQDEKTSTSSPPFPTLRELIVDHIRTKPLSRYLESETQSQYLYDHLDLLPFKSKMQEIIRANTPFYYAYPDAKGTWARPNSIQGPKKMYLTAATLVVVPAILLTQWKREIKKHIARPLRVCVISKDLPTPSARHLATEYDMVLITLSRFSSELKKYSDIQIEMQLYNSTPCKCPEFSDSIRVPQCTDACEERRKISPFLQIRWARLVVDEGNFVSSDNSDRVSFANMLSAERRWVVTGTPTTNLRGLNFGNDANECEETYANPGAGQSKRGWTDTDRQDLRKLGKMVSGFLAAPQFQSDLRLKKLKTHLIDPLLDPEGPRPGMYIRSFLIRRNLIAQIQFRRVEDVEMEAILQPCTKEFVLLDLEPYAATSFNTFQACLAINAIETQRKGSNKVFVNHTINNMWQTLFWRADDEIYNARETLVNANYIRKNATSRGMSEDDSKLLEESFKYLKAAVEDVTWKEMQMHMDVPYRVSNIDKSILLDWGRIYDYSNNSNGTQGFMHADQLLKLRDIIRRRPLISKDQLLEELQTSDFVPPTSNNDGDPALIAQSPYSNIRVGSSGSVKLNYILSEIFRYSAQEKFLIFSDTKNTPLSLYHVADGLELAQIKFLHLTTEIPAPKRELMVVEFENSDEHRVLLLDLRAAARGLNLVSASRIIFCEPVWEADLEMQAIKRAHRIGQTRPVTAKTLAIRGTAEENMTVVIANRKTQEKTPVNIQDDASMKESLTNTKFLDTPHDVDLPQFDFPLFRIPQLRSKTSSCHSVGHSSNARTEDEPPPRKKKKILRFDWD